ncbi:ThiF family adenylyltransferase [Chryseobacterium sp.]|uniref:ThiF family adenylyltransferase n=1 Tax=Chryseobacterium sp. TaxID=1871047 RepID=UPI001B240918|nr:ThiF family adenylyltransferase [Chryseobacterium sp.]MBO9692965.1 ThiF family adenylyltransferase [Chryseobacterium sp.]
MDLLLEKKAQMLNQDVLHNFEPSEELKKARRQLEKIQGYSLLQDFLWNDVLQKWYLIFKISLDIQESESVSRNTQWYLFVDKDYPDGDVWIMPSKKHGITSTFQHQEFNLKDDRIDWTLGKICLTETQGSWGRKQYLKEPRDLNLRLKWYVERCKQWIIAASTNTLVEKGDPFEFPPFPPRNNIHLVFNEDEASFKDWSKRSKNSGTFEAIRFNRSTDLYLIKSLAIGGDQFDVPWGNQIDKLDEEFKYGIWQLINKIPVISPWQIPVSFTELKTILEKQNIALYRFLYDECRNLRKEGKIPSFVMLGFPVSDKIGEEMTLIHWFAFKFPRLPVVKGFRIGSPELIKTQIKIALQSEKKIEWLNTENWNSKQLNNRGRLKKDFSQLKILIIGAGSVGSIFIQSLVRLGIINVEVLDMDILQAGNMSRHILTLDSVGVKKAEALSNQLNKLFPAVQSSFKNSSLKDVLKKNDDYLNGFDVVIDATANDEVLRVISNKINTGHKFFFTSISTGYMADSFYLYTRPSNEENNLEEDFDIRIKDWLRLDSQKSLGDEEVIEGVGCWHPLFPARVDDILMLTGAAIKFFEKEMMESKGAKLTVISKNYDDSGNFTGLNISNE